MGWRTGMIGAVLLAAIVTGPAAGAPGPELGQRFNGGVWTIDCPEGWVALNDEPLIMATSEAMIPALQAGGALPPGGAGIVVLPPFLLESYGLPAANSALELANVVATYFKGAAGEVELMADWPQPAYRVPVALAGDGELVAIGAQTPDGLLIGFLVQAADVTALLPLVAAMAATYAVR